MTFFELFGNFWPKSNFFQKLDHNLRLNKVEIFEKISKFLENFDQNRDFRKISKKSILVKSKNFWKIISIFFSKIAPKAISKIFDFSKNFDFFGSFEIFFSKNFDFFFYWFKSNFTKFSKNFFRKFDQNRKIFDFFVLKPKFFVTKNFDFGQNFSKNFDFSKILTKIEFFSKIIDFGKKKKKCEKNSIFAKNIDFGQIFEKFRFWWKFTIFSKISKNFDFGHIFEKFRFW